MVRLWTSEELESVLGGIKKHGAGKWVDILKDPQFASSLAHRDNRNLKDKWRRLRAYDDSNNNNNTQSHECNKWTIKELEAFLGGIKKHGARSWKNILNDPQFASSLANRSNTDLEDKWCNSDRSCDSRQKRTRNKIVNQGSIVEDLNDSHNHLQTCPVTRQRSGTHDKMINQDIEVIEIEEVNDSQDESDDRVNQSRKLDSKKVNNYLEYKVTKGWTIEEVKALFDGYEKYGGNKWQKIRNDPQFTSVLASRSASALGNKWNRLAEYDERRDNAIHPLPSSCKKQLVEELSDPKYHPNACTASRQKRTRNNKVNQGIKQGVVKDLNDSHNHIRTCTVTRQRSGGHEKMINQGIEVEDVSDSQDESNDRVNKSRKLDSKKVHSYSHKKSTKGWTTEEVKALFDGFEKYGANEWQKVVNDSQFASVLAFRSTSAMQNKWNRLAEYDERVQKRTRNNKVNQGIKRNVVEDLNDSRDHLHTCTVTRQRSGTRGKMINEDNEMIEIEEVSEYQNESNDYYSPCTITRQIRGSWRNRVNQSRKLDSIKVHNYLEELWLSLSKKKKTSVTYLDPLHYDIYSRDSYEEKEKVLKWIKKKDIFSKNYVFLPIVKWSHWMLLIFCHLGASCESNIKTPCILLLDSMAKTEHYNQLEPIIRRFVSDIYISCERTEDQRQLSFKVPKVPQQRDDTECGYFVLYYIKLFVENAPKSFSVSNGYPYFMKKDWFTFKDLDTFRETLDFTKV